MLCFGIVLGSKPSRVPLSYIIARKSLLWGWSLSDRSSEMTKITISWKNKEKMNCDVNDRVPFQRQWNKDFIEDRIEQHAVHNCNKQVYKGLKLEVVVKQTNCLLGNKTTTLSPTNHTWPLTVNCLDLSIQIHRIFSLKGCLNATLSRQNALLNQDRTLPDYLKLFVQAG